MTAALLGRPAGPEPLRPAATPAPDPMRGHVPALDGLRGVAILLVLMIHFICLTDGTPKTALDGLALKVAASGWAGVNLFFLLSGFLITGILYDAKDSPRRAATFYARRSLRIFPLYYGVLLLWFLVLRKTVHIPGVSMHWPPGRQLWAWLYAVNWGAVVEGRPFEPLGHFWSLAIEEHFYLVWPFMIWRLSRRGAMAACLVCIVTAVVFRCGLLAAGVVPGAVWQLDPSHLDSLALGGLIALAVRGPGGSARLVRPAKYVLLVAALALAGVVGWRGALSHADSAFQACGMPLLVAFFGAGLVLVAHAPRASVIGRVFTSPVLCLFGKYSYGLYVWHGLLFYHFARWFPASAYQAALGGSFLTAVLVHAALATLASLAVAVASYHLFEKHFLKLKPSSRPAEAPAPGTGLRLFAPAESGGRPREADAKPAPADTPLAEMLRGVTGFLLAGGAVLLGWSLVRIQARLSAPSGSPSDPYAAVAPVRGVGMRGVAGDWLLSEGFTVAGPAKQLRQRPVVRMRGRAFSVRLLGGRLPGVRATLSAADRPDLHARAELTPEGGEYVLTVALDPAELPAEGAVEVRFSFDRWFVPKALGMGNDNRELVLPAPHALELLPASAAPPVPTDEEEWEAAQADGDREPAGRGPGRN